jgi:dihydroneopterin aldolase
MTTIHLHNVSLYAYHGIYEEESVTGNNFEINLDVIYDEGDRRFEEISHTISYETLFVVVKQEMEKTTPLLEKVAAAIIEKISADYPFVEEIVISIFKLQAPIAGFKGKAGITMKRISKGQGPMINYE